jgi:hypothetical protein
MGGLIIGIILILVGLSILTGVHFLGLFVAIVLIVIGVRFIMRRTGPGSQWDWQGHPGTGPHHWGGHSHLNPSHEDNLNEVIVFSGFDKKIISDNFAGGKIVMVFAGGDLDLSDVKTTRTEIDLEVSCTFSGLDILIPKDWKVRSNAKVALGAVNTHAAPGGEGSVTLVIKGDVTCSNIEVRK